MREKLFGKENIKSLLYLFVIGLMFFIVSASNFASANLEWARLLNSEFWFKYGVTIGVGLSLFFVSIPYKKDKNKKQSLITDIIEELKAIKLFLIQEGLYEEFKIFLKKENINNRINKYKEYLLRKRDDAKKEKKIDYYSNKLEEVKEYEKCQKEDIEYKGFFNPNLIKKRVFLFLYVKVKIKAVNINVIFSNVSTSKEDSGETVHYTGRENLMSSLLPILLQSAIINALFLAVRLSFENGITLESAIQLCAKLWVMSTYLVRGLAYGDYSINTIYCNVIENRKGKALEFLQAKNIYISIRNNENYKYKIDKIQQSQEKEVADNEQLQVQS